MKLGATLAAVLVLSLAAVAVAANGSPQERAVNQACFARAGIGSATANFAAEVISPGTPANVRSWLVLIRTNLATIRGTLRAQPPAFRKAMLLGTGAFVRQFSRLIPALLAAPGGPAPPAQFARFKLASGLAPIVFAKTLGAVPC